MEDLLILSALGALLILGLIQTVWLLKLAARLRALSQSPAATAEPAVSPAQPSEPLPVELAPLRESQERLLAEAAQLKTTLLTQVRRLEQQETALESFAGMLEDQHALLERLDERSRVLSGRIEAWPSAIPSGEGAPSAEDIARAHLAALGYSEVLILSGEATEAGFRLPARGLLGQELRTGWITVREGRVTDARMGVPSTMFP